MQSYQEHNGSAGVRIMGLKNEKNDQKKLQVNIDKELAQNVDAILDSLGMNPTVLITALYKRVAAQGEIPFPLALTDREKALIGLAKAIDRVPSKHLNTPEDLAEWLENDE